jgi:hypothetical protein
MTSTPGRPSGSQLRTAIVLSTTEQECTLVQDEQVRVVPYARPFPAPRVERVSPGHLVATVTASDGSDVVIWRWFDAVVLASASDGGHVTLWEPGHGSVEARPREIDRFHRPGSRAYLSAGLPGADWWVAGPAVDRAESAEVDLEELQAFFTANELWDRLLQPR